MKAIKLSVRTFLFTALAVGSVDLRADEQYVVTGEYSLDGGVLHDCEAGEQYRLIVPSSIGFLMTDRAVQAGVDLNGSFLVSVEVVPVKTPDDGQPALGARRLAGLRAGSCDDQGAGAP